MAGTLQNKQDHSRSISLPARLHPNSLKIEEKLNKIKIRRHWQSSSSSLTAFPSNAVSIQTGLIKLAELYNTIEELLIHSPCTQQALQHKNLIEEALESSVQLLDACGNARDLMLNMKEQVQDLESALRRRGGDSTNMESNVLAYVSFRKKSRKDIAKCLKALKKAESHTESSSNNMVDVNDQHLSIVINVLRESSAITISILRSILLYLATQEMKAKVGGWSLIRKIIPGATEKSRLEIFNEVGIVDLAVYSLHGQIRKDDAKAEVQMTLGRLETLDFGIKGLETGLDCLFRNLIQNRVSLLNVLTP